MQHLRILIFLLALLPTRDGLAQDPASSPAEPLFRERPYGPRPKATPTPTKRVTEVVPETPIPTSWLIGGGTLAALAIAALLYGSARKWRSSNLFDRQYRFPVEGEPAFRLGAKKSGGHLARVEFGPIPKP